MALVDSDAATFQALPEDLQIEIFSRLNNPSDVFAVRSACRSWRDALCNYDTTHGPDVSNHRCVMRSWAEQVLAIKLSQQWLYAQDHNARRSRNNACIWSQAYQTHSLLHYRRHNQPPAALGISHVPKGGVYALCGDDTTLPQSQFRDLHPRQHKHLLTSSDMGVHDLDTSTMKSTLLFPRVLGTDPYDFLKLSDQNTIVVGTSTCIETRDRETGAAKVQKTSSNFDRRTYALQSQGCDPVIVDAGGYDFKLCDFRSGREEAAKIDQEGDVNSIFCNDQYIYMCGRQHVESRDIRMMHDTLHTAWIPLPGRDILLPVDDGDYVCDYNYATKEIVFADSGFSWIEAVDGVLKNSAELLLDKPWNLPTYNCTHPELPNAVVPERGARSGGGEATSTRGPMNRFRCITTLHETTIAGGMDRMLYVLHGKSVKHRLRYHTRRVTHVLCDESKLYSADAGSGIIAAQWVHDSAGTQALGT
eukprot:GFYU01011524.1.p1 GENE.GFYU01011524.1~~GFYU01011524.1.p1  ORF type:complete len:475 (+),score=28.13 GFYU01011524.1:136-1560(+)